MVDDAANWDDEENIKSITEGDLDDCDQSSGGEEIEKEEKSKLGAAESGKATPGSVTAKSNQS